MVLREKITQTDQSLRIANQFYGLKLKYGLQFMSSLLLPLVLGVFTAIITIQQQSAAREQRNQDRNASEKQRLEDQMAAKQLRELEGTLSDNRYKDDAFDAYIKEIGTMMQNNHGMLTSNLVTATITRAKTLTIFRRLDASRNIQIIQFLYEAGQLGEKNNQSALDISTAELREVDFRYLAINKKKLNDLSLAVIPNIPLNAKWTQDGATVAGSSGQDRGVDQLNKPYGLYVDDDQTVFIADTWNHRIVEWKSGATSGQVVAGGNGPGNQPNQLNRPVDVIVDKETDSLIICSRGNQRVVKWSRRSRKTGETIIENIDCLGLIMDDQGSLYVSNWEKHEVRRYRVGETNGTVVAGGNKAGDRFNQLINPTYVFVDRDHSVYVSDYYNHRVMKWIADAKEGIVVAGGRGQGSSLTQLSHPRGVFVDPLGRVYVADSWNHRVMRWCSGATQGTLIAGGNDRGKQANQLVYPIGLSFDRYGSLYVADCDNNRVQRFSIEL
ncbi:unnamed protein product [Rotaria socialis]|uniref:Uncharacterized protein n=3 Tax=Rotaria socialis TaxID=392032 RepID=A0A820SS36_9BILA|nr:unnamed protein product [Rotaria socialis]CAF4455259.1 unnamed protein product [Rotaria socialis]